MFSEECPRLRPLEALPERRNGRILLRDPTQLAAGMLVVGQQDLVLLSLLDGTLERRQIQAEYARHTGEFLASSALSSFLGQLAEAGYLAGPAFATYYARLELEYREAPYRPLRDLDGYGAPAARLGSYLDGLLSGSTSGGAPAGRQLRGIVAPHLDFPRGAPCYGAGYAALHAYGPRPARVVILATNHFGRSRSVVATHRDFQTPWGVVPTDRDFLNRLARETGGDLMPYELDHLREHSVELQVIWLHHLLGDGFSIVPVLCPDPNDPRPEDDGGVDLKRFAEALGRLVAEEPEETLLIASADLSHVGGYFGDERELDRQYLAEIDRSDGEALAWVDANAPEPFRAHMARTGNPSRICSAGCLYALMTALGPNASAERLGYHQAVTPELKNAVTCAAYAFWQ